MSLGKILVTGGGGFVGKALCKRLLSVGFQVVAVSRNEYPELIQLGVESIAIDLSDPTHELYTVLDGVKAVFHVAAKVEMWGRLERFL